MYKRQLLPHRQSRHGPHISVGDVNGDNLEDFYVGGAKGHEGALFIQSRNGSFKATNQRLWKSEMKYEDLGSTLADFDQDGDTDLYVVSGGGGDVEGAENLLQDRLYLNDGTGSFSKATAHLPIINSSGMRVVTSDYDDDGDLDLFVGGRIVPGTYPSAARSLLLENKNGAFVNVIQEKAPGLEKIGLVTDAKWVDFSGDGKLDIVVVGEWMRIELFEQSNDTFKNVTDQYISEDLRGWWFSVAVEDMDGDGDLDIIAGNLGLNNKFHPSKKKPFEIFFNDFDSNGTNDIVLAKTDDKGENYIMRGKDCSTQQMPFIKDKFEKYEDFALASITDVLPEEKLSEALNYSITDFSSVYLENVGGTYKKHILPIQAQFAPIQDILIRDFDSDGHKDILIAGNLFGTEIETASYDAGTGLYLKGNSTNEFQAIEGIESGLYLGKDLKDMAFINIGDKVYILGANNSDVIDIIQINNSRTNL